MEGWILHPNSDKAKSTAKKVIQLILIAGFSLSREHEHRISADSRYCLRQRRIGWGTNVPGVRHPSRSLDFWDWSGLGRTVARLGGKHLRNTKTDYDSV